MEGSRKFALRPTGEIGCKCGAINDISRISEAAVMGFPVELRGIDKQKRNAILLLSTTVGTSPLG